MLSLCQNKILGVDMNIQKFKEIVQGGQMFTVKFIKADGTERVMNARMGVSKYVKGSQPKITGKRNSTLAKTNQIGVYEMKGTSTDVEEKNYKTINLNTLIELKANGKIYNGEGELVYA